MSALYKPHAVPLICMAATRQRMQRHRGRTDEARRETVRVADRKRKRLGRQNEVDVRHSQGLAIARDYVLQLPNHRVGRLCM